MKIRDFFPIKVFQPKGHLGGTQKEKLAGDLGKMDFSVGQLLKGRITGFTPEGKILLDIDGQTVTAQSQLPLKVGSELWLEVKQAGPEPWFVLAGKKGAIQELLQKAFLDTSSIGKSLQNLFVLAEEGKGVMPPDLIAKLEAIMQGLGINSINGDADTEKIIRALLWIGAGREVRPNLLAKQLADFLTTLRQVGGEKFLDKASLLGLEKLVGMTEAFNNLNNQPPAPNQALFLLFPCFFAAGAGCGEWMFALDQESEAEQDEGASHYTLSFFLEMSKLGDINLRMTIKEKAVQGEFVVANEAVQTHLEGQLPDLRGIMEKLGYGPVYFSCRVASDNLMQIMKEDLEARAQLSSFNILDVTA